MYYKLFKFLSKTVLMVFCFSLLGTNSLAVAKTVNYISATDTLIGLSSYYSINSNLDLDRIRLVLVDPDKTSKRLSQVRYSGKIESSMLKNPGEYKLFMGYKISNSYRVLQTTTFSVVDSIGGDLVSLQSEDYRFLFEDIPDSIEPFKPFSLTVKVVNPAGSVDVNFLGKIVFIASDDNAQLPDEYTFMPADAGVKKFDNAFVFTEAGKFDLVVANVADENEYGEVELEVEFTDNSQQDVLGTMEVIAPISGVSTKNIISFNGRVDAGLEVSVLEGGVSLMTTNADAEGNFMIATPVLSDGEYKFIVKTQNAVSEEIVINVVTDSVKVVSTLMSPENVVTDSLAEFTVQFDTPVLSASAIINGVRNNLEAANVDKTSYMGQIKIPSEPEEYVVNLDVTSLDGVRTEIDNVFKFTSTVAMGSADISLFVPSKVQGVRAVAEDRKVVLHWSPATAEHEIDFYRIYYGTSPDVLELSVDTSSANTSWYISNLENGVKYFFKIHGVDKQGNLGDQGSDTVSATPGVNGLSSLHGVGGNDMVNRTSETGPMLHLSLFITALLSVLYRRVVMKT